MIRIPTEPLTQAKKIELAENAKKALKMFEYDAKLLEDVGAAIAGKRVPVKTT